MERRREDQRRAERALYAIRYFWMNGEGSPPSATRRYYFRILYEVERRRNIPRRESLEGTLGAVLDELDVPRAISISRSRCLVYSLYR